MKGDRLLKGMDTFRGKKNLYVHQLEQKPPHRRGAINDRKQKEVIKGPEHGDIFHLPEGVTLSSCCQKT